MTVTETAAEPHGTTAFIDRLKNELTAAVFLVGGIMLSTGWGLTWARLENEELPSRMVLVSLPKTYFVTVAIESMLSPLVIATLMSSLWVPIAVTIAGSARRFLTGWTCFGFALGWVVAALIVWFGDAARQPAASRLTAAAVIVSALLAVGLGAAVWRFRPPGGSAGWWATARPILAASVVLCFLVTCSVRIVDARYTGDGLPFAQVVADGPCARVLHGIDPGRTAEGKACQIGGFYLGDNGDWALLVQRKNPCPAKPPAAPPQLVMISRDKVQIVVAREHAPPPKSCPSED